VCACVWMPIPLRGWAGHVLLGVGARCPVYPRPEHSIRASGRCGKNRAPQGDHGDFKQGCRMHWNARERGCGCAIFASARLDSLMGKEAVTYPQSTRGVRTSQSCNAFARGEISRSTTRPWVNIAVAARMKVKNTFNNIFYDLEAHSVTQIIFRRWPKKNRADTLWHRGAGWQLQKVLLIGLLSLQSAILPRS
jgi:hypothetical protein